MKIYRQHDGDIPTSGRNPIINGMKPGYLRDGSIWFRHRNQHTLHSKPWDLRHLSMRTLPYV